LKEAAPERDWETKARAAISRADRFMVMLGPKTRYAAGVKKEVAMAKSRFLTPELLPAGTGTT